MDRKKLTAQLRSWAARHPTRTQTARQFLDFVEQHEDCAERSLKSGHLTASACVLDDSGAQMLLIEHRKLDQWLQPGGHADGDLDLLAVALREVEEETGVTAQPLRTDILDLDRHRIPERPGEPEHWHYDVRFLLGAPKGARPVGNEETHGARWVPFDQLNTLTRDDSVLRLAQMAVNQVPGGSASTG